MIRVIMRYQGLCIDILVFALQLRKTQETSVKETVDEDQSSPQMEYLTFK
jgi:hypothetical protein